MGAEAAKPVMAHRFLNYLLDRRSRYDNFAGYVGYQPPITKIDPKALIEQQIDAGDPAQLVVTREDYANGNAYLGADGRRPPAVGPVLGRVPHG